MLFKVDYYNFCNYCDSVCDIILYLTSNIVSSLQNVYMQSENVTQRPMSSIIFMNIIVI